MTQAVVPSVDSVISREVTRLGSCTLDELAQRLPDYSWGQVFSAVDRLSRAGTVTLQRPRSSGYIISLSADRSAELTT
jgi:hypothetical protein